MQTVYSYSGRDIAESRRTLAVTARNEFADGDVEIESTGSEVRSLIRRGLNQPIQFMRSIDGTGVSFRRCWHHIRSRRAALHLLHFIFQGELRVVSSGGSYTVRPGQCAIINADEPFYSRTLVGEQGTFECAFVQVPEHLVLSHMPWVKGLNASFELGAEHRRVVSSLLDILCFEGERLSRATAEPLAEAFLRLVSDGMQKHVGAATPGSNLIEKRYTDIQECIRKHLTCSDLSGDRVAAYCGISTRYLCHVLRANHTSFSDLLWSQRLPKARDWLLSAAFQHYPIQQIARMSGFKSAAHFSRMFKCSYGICPKQYRAIHSKATRGCSGPDSSDGSVAQLSH